MSIIDKLKKFIGMEEEDKDLVTLLTEGSIEKAKGKFSTRTAMIDKCLEQWNTEDHEITSKQSRKLVKGDLLHSWNLPIAYQRKIVSMAVAFLYGAPIKLKQQSKGTDKAFALLQDLRDDMRMDAKNQECATLQMSETECAKLFVEYRDSDADPTDTTKFNSVKCILLARSKGDIIHVSFDSFGVLRAVGREYKVRYNNKDIEHFDVYTAETNFFCNRQSGRWEVEPKINLIGKIPIVVRQQKESESHIVEPLIKRREYLTSARADVNTRSGDPILVLEGDRVGDLPDAEKTAKVVHLKNGSKAYYLVPQMSVDMVKDEKEDLKELIHYITDTPDLSMDKMMSSGLKSGKAIEMAFFGSTLKSKSKHGYEAEMIDRENEILKAFIYKVIDTSLEGEVKKLKVTVEFGNPLPDNMEDFVNILSVATGSKPIMSRKTAVELNPMIKDADAENKLIDTEEMSIPIE
ncbi:hypothetical protein N180_02800 [Pedobacter antarcticus 4BY]|uniref:Phage portal protein n=2 Tax=Pedobacter antarcticus TaxID=34086 RepID=A0A081PKH1_9SPHI|nr:phage portal protein [Pedobacter antarcticus]KEQ31194.1 hypothetical protein N180_02800 [Pedobacter antarcticus 4BY]SFE54565.1 phage portal protein, SPP1 family [Pedobacter antarcticus]